MRHCVITLCAGADTQRNEGYYYAHQHPAAPALTPQSGTRGPSRRPHAARRHRRVAPHAGSAAVAAGRVRPRADRAAHRGSRVVPAGRRAQIPRPRRVGPAGGHHGPRRPRGPRVLDLRRRSGRGALHPQAGRRPPWSGSGLGDALLDWACAAAFSAGLPWVRLDCAKANPRLQGYYRDRGFRHVRTVDLPHRSSGALFQRPSEDVQPTVFRDLTLAELISA
ncbi:GNAT family N-acetyltransferase [Nonomuraea thailandensis]